MVKTIYRTSDGQEFETKEAAEIHENAFKVEIKDELNKILIKIKNNKLNSELPYFKNMSEVLEIVLQDDYSPGTMIEQYYNSNCY